MNTPATTVMYEWKDIPWRKLERDVFKLQKRIFQATKRGDVKTVHRLQRLLLKSQATTLIAVRKVTQDNRGKKTAGIDGVKSLAPVERLQLAQKLIHQPFSTEASPVRRIWIPKRNTDEKRPLGIPTMEDRARQAQVKLVLEPEWEAKFETHSFGFRPGRSAHDALRVIYHCINDLPRYVLDADIAKCFDRINHTALLKKLDTFPAMRRVIHQWLHAGVLDGEELFPTTEGTPQGGVLSPLLANVALHGLQMVIEQAFPAHPCIHPTTGAKTPGKRFTWKPTVVRYADDFVILHQDIHAIQKAKEITATWLKEIGLELKEAKTRITHTLSSEFGTPGFNFLGFNVRQYEQGKNHHRKVKTYRLPFRTFIKPAKETIAAHVKDLSHTIRAMRTSSQEDLIAALNPKITGWANYQAIGLTRELNRLDHILFQQLKRWSRRRHPMHPWKWVARKYWRLETGRWTFGTPDGTCVLANHQRKALRQYPVRSRGSIFDGDWVYWTRRLGKHPGVTPSRARFMRKQDGKCSYCGLYFKADSEIVELDHTDPRLPKDWKHSYNLQLLHAHCHDQKTARDYAVGIRNNDRIIEELDEGKSSRPVLKTSALGD